MVMAVRAVENSLAAAAERVSAIDFVVLMVPFFEREVLVFLRFLVYFAPGRAGLLGRQKAAGSGWEAVP